ncbi:MAG TPA: Maf family nucleotide pyrophosphatase, partial [Casimicrobiaceae bacterium]|nr:Maf family nucleotide pyrophosphatase [Casimicrobiaceae bacterium]
TSANPVRPLVLASTSRYRAELLARVGLPFSTDAPNVDESPRPGESPAQTALRLAEAKAREVAGRHANALVIGADQVADADGRIVGKAGVHERAVEQLSRLSGRTIVFHTGIALVDAASGRCQAQRVDVASTFRPLTRDAIERYLQRERPYDCAGSVKVEALGIALFEKIVSDDPTALIGLPMIALVSMLAREGVDVLAEPPL